MSHVDLGFLEKVDPLLLKSHHFPSKVGGKPAWLNLHDLPKPEHLKCKVCTKQLHFLCQIYAPVETKDTCFHRTLFLFICHDHNCSLLNKNDNLLVLRSQLKRSNDFYSYDPPNDNTQFDVERIVKLCQVCGSYASKHCSKCKRTNYCTREHQVSDWKSHKLICGSTGNSCPEEIDKSSLFEEFELVIEKESVKEVKDVDERKELEELERLTAEGKAGTMLDVSEDELQSHASTEEDKMFTRFRKRIKMNPDQVLRYEMNGTPLWIGPEPTFDIPTCELCNSPRQFEFQVMPQLLYELHENELDFGTLIVYTCAQNCDNGPAYKNEFVYKQDFIK